MGVVCKFLGVISGGIGIYGIFTGQHNMIFWGAVIAILLGGYVPLENLLQYFINPFLNAIFCAVGMLISHFFLKLAWGDAFLYSSCWIMTVLSVIGFILQLQERKNG
jgi:hypothetical protein